MVGRHEALRTRFPQVEGEPYQEIVPVAEARVELPVVPVEAGELEARVEEVSGHVFDLAGELPVRAALLTSGEESSVLVLVVHHIAGDGWSLAPLWRDVSTAYAARRSGSTPDFSPLPVQYADYALWQQRLFGDEDAAGGRLTAQVEHWRATLDGVPHELALPFDRPRPARPGRGGGWADIEVPAELHARLAGLARSEGVTMFMVWQAAVAVLLSRLGAGEDIPLGSPVAGRTDESLEDLVGFFLNTLVLRTDLSGDPAFTDVLARVRSTALDALDHQDVPFDRLVEKLAPARYTDRVPFFQVLVAVQNMPQAQVTLPGLDVDAGPGKPTTAKVDLDVQVVELHDADGAPNGMAGGLTYATDLFDHSTAESLVARLLRVLDAVTADPAPAGSPASTSSTPPNGAACSPSRTAPAATPWHSPSPSCSPSAPPAPRRPSPSTPGPNRSPTDNWTPAPTGSPTTSSTSASARRPWSPSSWTAPRTWSPPCWPCSRRAAPTSRSTPPNPTPAPPR
ncbi:hypothetical protein IHE61_21960 [Streptomyces sp. GKU 257-1]|nr:hypothetical protein [Streptomyces sp. GKU 257-1]